MTYKHTRRGFTQEINAIITNGHSRALLSGIPTLDNKIGVDSRLQDSGMTNKINCHAEKFQLSIPTAVHMQGRDPEQRHLRMTFKGFTLIELLVVVLIIGILAAVALPQYQKAVARSRFAGIKPLAKAVKEAQEVYFDEHGTYGSLSVLDVQVPTGAFLELSDTEGHAYVRASHDKLANRYTRYFNHSENFAGNVYCEALTGNTRAEELCMAEGAQGDPITNGDYSLYLLSGNSTGGFISGPTLVSSSYGGCTYINPGPYGSNCRVTEFSDGTKIEDIYYNYRIVDVSGNDVQLPGISRCSTSAGYAYSDDCGGSKVKDTICEAYPDWEKCTE